MKVYSDSELLAMHGAEYVQWYKASATPRRLERLMPFFDLQPTHAVADFACGGGILMDMVAPAVASYVGVDFSAPFIQAAEERRLKLRIDNAAFKCASIEDFCAACPQTFDRAFAMDFSEHVYDEPWAALLTAMRRSLKPGGILYLHTPNREFILEVMKAHNFILRQFEQHVAVRTPAQLLAMLEAAGFHDCRCHLLPHYNVVRYLHPLSYLPLAGKWFKARILIEATA